MRGSRPSTSAREVAQALNTTATSVNSALQRARRTIDERLPDRSQQATARALGDTQVRDLVTRYVAAWERRDVKSIVALLVEDAVYAMPPFPHWFRGRNDVIAFIAATGTPSLRHVITSANGQPAIAWYIAHGACRAFLPASIEVLALDGARVASITAFASPELFPVFDLPATLPA